MSIYTNNITTQESAKLIATKRLISQAIIVAALSMFLLITAPSSKAHAISLKSQAIITGNMITLGDLFEDLKQDNERVLGPAPQPGQNMVLNARTLLRVAHAFDLSWRPKTSYEQITLRRDATIIGSNAIEKSVKEELRKEGVSSGFKVNFYQAYPKIILPGNVAANVDVKSMSFDRSKNRFSVLLAAPSIDNPIQTLELSGEIVKTITIPVAKDTVQSGDLIDKTMVNWVEIEERQLQSDTIVSFDDLHNMTPRRVLLSGKPISSKDIIAPRLVERGNEVTMVYKHAGMDLTAKGKALQGGSKGDTIRVVNLASSRPIEAKVTADRIVTVYN
jgi:flagella basal body P-ring formation protein FlgA